MDEAALPVRSVVLDVLDSTRYLTGEPLRATVLGNDGGFKTGGICKTGSIYQHNAGNWTFIKSQYVILLL